MVVYNMGVMKSSTLGSGYISVKDLFDQNRGELWHYIIVRSYVKSWYV